MALGLGLGSVGWAGLAGLPDTSAPRHFGTKTVWHHYGMVPKCLETIRHQFFTGAELSGHFGPDSSAPVPKYLETLRHHPSKIHMGYCFVRISLLLVLYAQICRSS